ncbi:MAG: cytochrome oxidase assembly protein [Deltaproteobacteria bacterium]|jgi:cytochrome c oxidase assembly protein subunit 15|nr:MAG: cytochrome oxidase assembly protein [Deltaproteobacteria bacterium]
MKAEAGRLGLSANSDAVGFSPWPHRLAVALACATFPLLFIGGLVTSKGAGLAVPDWPTTFGHNMFLYPWSKMIGNIFYEHSHRLVASFVGLLAIALAVAFWLRERRAWLRWLSLIALGLVITQGVLGGLRVVLLESTLAIIHACFAQAFFALTVALALFTSREWRSETIEARIADGGRLWRLGAMTTAFIYIQVIFGAVLRHTGERLDAHLFFAGLVAVHVILLLLRATKYQDAHLKLVRSSYALGILMLLQLLLGAGSYLAKFTVLLRLPIDMIVLLTTTHLIVGALMLVTSLALTLRSYRLSAMSKPALGANALTEQFSI